MNRVRAKLKVMGELRNATKQLKMEFSMENKIFNKTEKTERKIWKRIRKNNYVYRRKIESNIDEIRKLVAEMQTDEIIRMVSNVFDSPNIANAFIDKIELLYISTWSVTPAGIAALVNIAENDVCSECVLLMDKTHSYKWIFADGAYDILKNKVTIRFCAVHSKFIVMKLTDGTYLNFIGSMNWSNNPRWENIEITKSKDDFDFYSDFIINVQSEQLKNGRG